MGHDSGHKMHKNSLSALSGSSVELTKRTLAVARYLALYGPCTDREVMYGLGFTDPNKVRPRISELIKENLAEECGEKRDPQTQKVVRLVRLVGRNQADLF